MVCGVAALLASAAAGALPEYPASEAHTHIGERATIVGTVDDIGHGRRHVDLVIGGRELSKAQLWIVLPNDATGPELDPETLRGVTIAVTGKIESSGGTPQVTVKSTTQIQPRSAPHTNYIGRAYDKEQNGDINGAIADLEQAIEHQPVRRDEACEHLARLKEKRGDWAGALAAYDRLIAFDPNKADSYYVRATAKKRHGDFEAAMADFGKAAELRSSANDYIQMGNWRREQGDNAAAAAEYDKAIALCDRQIAGTARSYAASPLGTDPYFSRGYARELKGDLEGAVADYSRAIANNPGRAGMAYGARGNIRRARGDLTGASSDYQHKYQITHYPDDEKPLIETRAKLRNSGNTKSKKGSQDVALSTAKAEYAASTRDEAARVRYVTELADIRKQMLERYWNTGDKSELGSDLAHDVDQELRKHPAPSNVDARELSQLLVGKWRSPRHVYVFRADGTYGVEDSEQRDKWRINGNEYIEDVSRGPIVLLDGKYFIYAEGQGVAFYLRVNDSPTEPLSPDSVTPRQTSRDYSPAAMDAAIEQKLLGYWKSPRHGYHIAADGIIYMCPRKYATTTNRWAVKDGNFYWDNEPHSIVTLNDNKFVYREIGGRGITFTLIRGTKEEVDPQ